MDEHEKWMRVALEEARAAFDEDEVPVGAVLVLNGEIISRGHNLTEQKKDATAHGELLCLQRGALAIGDWRLVGAVLYTTLEPCSMCLGAAILSRARKIYYGAPDLRHGACGSWVNLIESNHPIHRVECVGGILAEECGELMTRFFRAKRGRK